MPLSVLLCTGILACAAPVPAAAQATTSVALPEVAGVPEYGEIQRSYPLPPVSYVRIPLRPAQDMLSPNAARIGQLRLSLRRVGSQELNPPREVPVLAQRIVNREGTQYAYLFLKREGLQVTEDEEYELVARPKGVSSLGPPHILGAGFPINVKTRTNVDVKLPLVKQDQELIGGKETTVGQVRLNADADAVFKTVANERLVRVFLASESKLSTNQRDRDAGYKLRLGLTRGLPGNVKHRIQLTGDLITNQIATDSTYVLGVRYALTQQEPRKVSLIQNRLFYSPYLPETRIGVEYRNRFQVDDRLYRADGRREVLALKGRLVWDHIRLFRPGKKSKIFTQAGPELDVKLDGWYFPQVTTFSGAETNNAKGSLEVGITYPLRVRINRSAANILDAELAEQLAVPLFERVVSLRVGYRVGAEETSGFQPNNTILFGVDFKTR